ncbi:hypothetical protein AC519_2601 [Pseudomonas savastanoi]|nr:hypothetical protein AC519_2601 [Pseudomonas savastanoi]
MIQSSGLPFDSCPPVLRSTAQALFNAVWTAPSIHPPAQEQLQPAR